MKIFYVFLFIMLLTVQLVNQFSFARFVTGQICLYATTLAYMSIIMVLINVIYHTWKPDNDPGLFIWYLCCLRVGQTGKYNKRSIKKNEKARKKKQTYESDSSKSIANSIYSPNPLMAIDNLSSSSKSVSSYNSNLMSKSLKSSNLSQSTLSSISHSKL